MHSTTGLTPQRFTEVIWHLTTRPTIKHTWPGSIGLRNSLKATLIYLHRNRTQDEVAETLEVARPTISRAITTMTPLLAAAFRDTTSTTEDLAGEENYIVDSTMRP